MKTLKNSNRFSLKGKNAIITGAVGFLGKYFCIGLAEAGANVAAIDLNRTDCLKFTLELQKKFRVKSVGISCDITDKKAVKEMTNKVLNDFSSIDILVNNACYRPKESKLLHAPFEEYSLEEWNRMMNVNVNGAFLCSQSVGQAMIKQGRGGSIIQISSIYGLLGTDQRIYDKLNRSRKRCNNPAAYSVSKGAIIALTKYLASYWADKRIRVNVISPGGVQKDQDREFIDAYSIRVPMGRMAKPTELLGALIYLASDTSSYVTGQNIIVDGGFSIW